MDTGLNFKEIIKTVRNTVIMILASVMIGYLLLVIAFALPYDVNEVSHYRSVYTLREEGIYPSSEYSVRITDNWADSYMILISEYDGPQNAFKKAADAYYYSDDVSPYHSITTAKQYTDGNLYTYGRYWHGYVLFMRLFLRITDYGGIRIISFVIMTLLIIVNLLVLLKKMKRCALPFALSMLFISPVTASECLEYSYVIFIMLIMCLIVMSDHPFFLKKGRMKYIFLFCGIAVAYFDFLTAPFVALFIPLTLMYIKRNDDEGILLTAFVCIVLWTVGYAGMWAGKWAIAYISGRQGFLSELTFRIKYRSSNMEYTNIEKGRLKSVYINFRQLFVDKPVGITMIVYAGVMVAAGIIKEGTRVLRDGKKRLILFIPLAASVCWYLVLANHSLIHHELHTYRTAVPAVFGVLCAIDARIAADKGC